jgi:hypothetical protein
VRKVETKFQLNPEEIMITKEIKLCGKQVTLAYNYATEISYKLLAGQDIQNFMQEVSDALQAEPQQMPDIRKTFFLLLASMQSYYDSLPAGQDGQKPQSPVTDHDLMYHCTPQESGVALGTIIGLRSQFYHVPSDEPEDKPAEGKEEKND